MEVAQRDVWWADLGEPVGSAPGYRRPVVVVQCDALNTSRIGTVVCVPLTSNLKCLLDSHSGNTAPPVTRASTVCNDSRTRPLAFVV